MIALKSQIRLLLSLSLSPRHRLECTRIHATTLLGWFLFWFFSLFDLDIPTSCSVLFTDFKTVFGFCCRTLPSICRKNFRLQWEIAKNTQNDPFWVFEGYRKWHLGCLNQNSKTTFQYKYPRYLYWVKSHSSESNLSEKGDKRTKKGHFSWINLTLLAINSRLSAKSLLSKTEKKLKISEQT